MINKKSLISEREKDKKKLAKAEKALKKGAISKRRGKQIKIGDWVTYENEHIPASQAARLVNKYYKGVQAKSDNIWVNDNDADASIRMSTIVDKYEKEAMGIINKEKQTILQEAQGIVYGCRQASYGKVSTNFGKIAKMWEQILGVEVTPEQVGMCMIAVKIARQCHKPSRDNLVDIAGYAATIEKLQKGE